MSKHTPPQQLHGPSSESSDSKEFKLHEPVLLEHVIELLAPQKGESYLDLTAGYGGHASRIVERTGAPRQATLVDRDSNAIAELQSFRQAGARLIHDDFAHAAETLAESGEAFDMILVDLGVSSPQLDREERGFSFRLAGPLDMRMDNRQTQTAADMVNRLPRDELARIIHDYGEESTHRSRVIAQAIVQGRPYETTTQLADVILSTHRGRWQKTHPATRTFQALRIALNDELGQLQRFLITIPKLLNPGGRIAIISFHSLEDRLVKRYLAEQAEAGYEAELALLTKKAIRGATETVHNPRARSAVLRAAVKK